MGVGKTDYSHYDRRICETACRWIERNGQRGDKPWVLFVSFVSPHYPMMAPREFYDLYDFESVGWPHRHKDAPDHPALQEIYRFYNYNDFFTDQRVRQARRGYYGLCSFVDSLVGRLLDTLDAGGLGNETRVIYTTDHGELLGDHGMWTKMLMYEGSAAIPLILAGPGVPEGRVVDTPVSLVDCRPTILEGAGVSPAGDDEALPGHSLFAIAQGARPERTILSEFHDGGSRAGYFMIRRDEWKYVYYVGSRPQLFDLARDPQEDEDLGDSPRHAGVRQDCEAALREILDPEAVNKRALDDQARRVAAMGGREAVLAMEGCHFGFTPLSDITAGLDLEPRDGFSA